MNTPIIFNGSIPQHYEEYLTPFLFDPFADDLLQRVQVADGAKILELASGTGSVTRKLLALIPSTASLLATDLQADMLEVAKQSINAPNLTWDIADMTRIPYDDDSFNLIVCQFGLMLVPDKLPALTEIRRVLKPGGKLIFNVWGSIEANDVWRVAGDVIASFTGINAILQYPGPFSLSNEDTVLQLMKDAGFAAGITVTAVNKTGITKDATAAAKGFIEGLPVFQAIGQKDPALVPEIQAKLEQEFERLLPNHPLQSPLQALVFQAIK